MTECTQSSFEFQAHFSRQVVARFDGGTMTSDAGAVLLRETDRRLGLLPRLAGCFEDRRQPWLISHTVQEMVAQRVYALALGYEDLTDHDQLREDPLLAVLSGKPRVGEEPLAVSACTWPLPPAAAGQRARPWPFRIRRGQGKSTLNRLELGGEVPSRYKKIHYRQEAIDELLTKVFLEAHAEAPEQIVLDLDTTDLPLHGHQEGRFFHGYYDSYCYVPLFIFADEHVLCARLRTADQEAAAGSKDELELIVRQIRAVCPAVLIIVKSVTVVGWHRAGFKIYWRWRSRPRGGRPKITEEIRVLIRRLAQENPDWGAPKIHGELQKLGSEVSERTVARYLRRIRRRGDPSRRWLAFLQNHREVVVAFDFFTVPTLTFQLLYCFFVIEHGRRRILHCNLT